MYLQAALTEQSGNSASCELAWKQHYTSSTQTKCSECYCKCWAQSILHNAVSHDMEASDKWNYTVENDGWKYAFTATGLVKIKNKMARKFIRNALK